MRSGFIDGILIMIGFWSGYALKHYLVKLKMDKIIKELEDLKRIIKK